MRLRTHGMLVALLVSTSLAVSACGDEAASTSDDSTGSTGDGDNTGVAGDGDTQSANGDGDTTSSGGQGAQAAGDGDQMGGDGDQMGGDGDPDPPVASSGCGMNAPDDSGMITVGSEERTYHLILPDDYDSSKPYPLLFSFHGRGGSGESYVGASKLVDAVSGDAILVYPDAVQRGAHVEWQGDGEEDLNFFDALVERFSQQLCVDDSRIFVTGYSAGGFFTNRLGCYRGDVIRAIAPLAGGGFLNANNCVGQVAVWTEHGTSDMVVKYAWGVDASKFWAEQNGCDQESTSAVDPAPCVTYSGCDDGFPTHWCASEGAHEVRGNFTGPGSWAFFSSL